MVIAIGNIILSQLSIPTLTPVVTAQIEWDDAVLMLWDDASAIDWDG